MPDHDASSPKGPSPAELAGGVGASPAGCGRVVGWLLVALLILGVLVQVLRFIGVDIIGF